MDFRISLLAVCVAALLVAGCTDVSQAPATPTPAMTPEPAATPVIPATSPAAVTTTACAGDVCSFIPASPVPAAQPSLKIRASPLRYSPMMSSTPGIGLELNATGFNASAAAFTWNASYGQFLSWGAHDYTVTQLGAPASNHGGKLYWSFTDRPASTAEPVVITVRATDPATGAVLGTSTVTLAWEGDYAVTVRDN